MFNPSGPDDILEVEVQIPFEPLRKERGSALWSVQKPFFESEARYPAFYGGRGVGKTTVGAAKFVDAVLRQPMEALVVLPTDKQIAQKSVLALQEMIPTECVIPQEKGIVHATKGLIEVHFGLLGRPEGELSRIWLRTAENPNAIRNLEVGIVWMDELQDIDEYTFTDCVKYACRAPGTPQQVFSTFTPPRDEKRSPRSGSARGRTLWAGLPRCNVAVCAAPGCRPHEASQPCGAAVPPGDTV